ncbi:MAG: fructosamine kinase family protein, partial [Solirubrobacterales bacterium]|nr:fructosamine kinase family protein [Solirubrobacterales bacterium]
AEPGALRVARALEVSERYLALEWIDHGRLTASGEEALGRGLARVHLAGAPHFGDPWVSCDGGDEADGRDGRDARVESDTATAQIGSLRLPNEPLEEWPAFYAQRRLAPLVAIALERGAIGGAGAAAVERVCERVEALAGPPEPPARLHGDLWVGNVLADREGGPWLIDPSAYGGHREVDLAMLRLFGSPSERIFAAYEELAPLAAGWEERVELWQLAPLLVHAVLFGGGYRPAAEAIARRYGG